MCLGEIVPVAGTPFDLRAARRLGDVIYQVAGTVVHPHPFVKFSNRYLFSEQFWQ
jgi:hypothetical protein